jgi:signal transduction histidine kinase
MKRLLATILALAVAVSAAAQSPTRATEAEAVAMVRKAIQYYDKHGRQKALAEFMRAGSQFIDRDLYVVVYDMDGTALAHVNPRMVGKNLIDLRDADGKYIQRERIAEARVHASGWQRYKFYNPVDRKVEPKHMYWEKHDGLVFGCGVYDPE